MNIAEILKNCPKGLKLYSSIHGEVELVCVNEYSDRYPIYCKAKNGKDVTFTSDGRILLEYPDAECVLFPSKDQRDWSKFTAPWYKKEKFDPKTLTPFDKVLVRNDCREMWKCNLFSHISEFVRYPYIVIENGYRYCIPFNNDTIHIAGTRKEAPEYYRYWED